MEEWDSYVAEANTDFGEKLRHFRELAGLRQTDLAQQLHLQRTSITNMETGRQTPTVPQLIAIAQVLGVEAPELMPNIVAPVERSTKSGSDERVDSLYRVRDELLKIHAV